MVKRWLVIFFYLKKNNNNNNTCPWATEHNVYSCYLMSCLVNVPLSSVRSRRLRCAKLCLRDGSAYTSFLRIHTQDSSRQSKLWGEQQHTRSVLIAGKTQTHIFSSCLLLLLWLLTAFSHMLKPNAEIVKVVGNVGLEQIHPTAIL